MTTEEALGDYLSERNVIEKGSRREDWYKGNWFFFQVFGVKVPIFPLVGFRKGLVAHDAHHMITGYPTSWFGECEVAAWELASGGCGLYLVYWIDRLLFFLIALVTAPVRTLRAFRRGLGKRNLYRLDPDRLLAMELDEVRRYIAA